MDLITVILVATGVYAAIGLVFAVAFVIFGIGRVDPAARTAPKSLRAALIPACAALWPLMARKWVTAPRHETDR